ncbi:hypothetical protein BX666DRAFT_782096 [Dichotomocladium elegans]|nr:hypothetical protein BX666DRAFT_782096 [Dichotomocladium elegans]
MSNIETSVCGLGEPERKRLFCMFVQRVHWVSGPVFHEHANEGLVEGKSLSVRTKCCYTDRYERDPKFHFHPPQKKEKTRAKSLTYPFRTSTPLPHFMSALRREESLSQSQSLDASFEISQDGAFLSVNDISSIRIDHADTIADLTQAWINERCAPELLPYRRYLVEPLIKSVEDQTETVMDTMVVNPQHKFISMLYQNEIERIKFVIRSYLRTRLAKIERCTLEILRKPDYDAILSPQEIAYARRYKELMESHNHESFLHLLPTSQHKQDEKLIDLDMVVTANLEAPVFIRVKEQCGPVELDRNEEPMMLEKDDIYILRYNAIRTLLLAGKVDLV